MIQRDVRHGKPTVEREIVPKNPAAKLDLIPTCASERARQVIFSLGDIKALAEAPVDEERLVVPIKSLFLLMLNTGLRKGEALHMEWSDVDWEQRVLHVRNKPQCPTAYGLGWTPKCRKERLVLLNDTALAVLQALPRRESVRGSVGRRGVLAPAQFIFTQRIVEKIDCRKKCTNCETAAKLIRLRDTCGHRAIRYERCDSVKKTWRSFLRSAGIDETKYVLEDTRRTFNSYALSHAEFDQRMACFALGNTQMVNQHHYTNAALLQEATVLKLKEGIERLPFNLSARRNVA